MGRIRDAGINVGLLNPLPITIADAAGYVFESGFNYGVSPTHRIRRMDVALFLLLVLWLERLLPLLRLLVV